ncbi:unnamed protein product [Prorocentrum cordatum]|uniref:Ion transport domain-containing protein n=1 Tax=Prorocentrum cordatum TaxID=2364126 RepID=A0ABN9V362_9DINO|nr:unnamed protein product [Polarella glacialis]
MAAAGHSDSDTEFGLFSRHGDYARQSSLEQERDLPSARQRLRDMLEDPSSSGAAQAVQYFIVGAIITGSLITVVETMPSMRTHAPFLYVMDFLVTIVYSIEIVLRLYTTDSCVGFCGVRWRTTSLTWSRHCLDTSSSSSEHTASPRRRRRLWLRSGSSGSSGWCAFSGLSG